MWLYSLGLVALAAGSQLKQHVIGQDSCDAAGQNEVHAGMCECEKECCNTPEDQLIEGCPIDVVIGIDMCSCNNDTWTEMRRFTLDMVNTLNSEYGISDNDNSARLHVFQFMENTKDVVGFDTFTRNELEKSVLGMGMAEFHGRSTNVKAAIDHAKNVLQNSPRTDIPGRKAVFALITNGYSDDKLVKSDQVLKSAADMHVAINAQMVFVAREDSSMPNKANSHTNEELAQMFDSRERLSDPVAAQQIVGDVNCDEKPPIDYHRECNCVCDVPMGCHGPQGPPGVEGEKGGKGPKGPNGAPGKKGDTGEDGPDGEQGEDGGCGMPGDAGPKGEPGKDGSYGKSGTQGVAGIKGPPGEPGAAGPQGDPGDAGQPGAPGVPGVQGEPGDEGDRGEPGPEGTLDEDTLKWLVNKIFIEELNALNLQTPQT